MNDQKIHWQSIIELSIVLFTILGSTIPLYLHTDSKVDAFSQRTHESIESMRLETNYHLSAIREEMKDFHGRLCAIEERNKGK